MAIRKNAIITFSGQFLSLSAFALLTPLYLHTIGYERYGLVSVIWAFTAYFSKFDLGIGSAITYFVSGPAQEDPQQQSALLWTGVLLAIPVGLSAGGLLLLLAGAGGQLFRLSEAVISELMASRWALLGIGLSLIVSSCATGLLLGRQRFLLIATGDVTTQVLSIVLPVVAALLIVPSVEVVISATLAARLLGLLLLFAGSQVALRGTKPTASRQALRALLGYGSWVSLGNLLEQVINSADRFVIAAVAGPASLPRYVIPHSILSRATIFPGSLMGAVFPRLVAELGEGNDRLIHTSLRFVTLLSPLLLVAMLLAEVILRLWLGEEFSEMATAPMRVLILAVWLETIAFVLWYVILAQARPIINFRIAAAVLAPYVLLLYLGTSWWGVAGAAAVYGVRNVAYLAARALATGMARTVVDIIWRQGLYLSLSLVLTQSLLANSVWGFICGVLLLAASLIEATHRLPPEISDPLLRAIRDAKRILRNLRRVCRSPRR